MKQLLSTSFICIRSLNCAAQNLFKEFFDINGNNNDQARSIVRAKDGNYFVCGTTMSYPQPASRFFVAKIDEQGNLLWSVKSAGDTSEGASGAYPTFDSG